MTDMNKRSLMKVAALTALTSAVLIGCGKKEEAAPAAAPAPAVVEAPKAEPLKIAFAYVGPVGDGGWTFAHDNGRKAIEAEFGDKVVTSFVENVPESADAERVIRDLAGQGNKLIFGTTFGYMEPMLKVAPDFKDVKFEHATGYKTAEKLGKRAFGWDSDMTAYGPKAHLGSAIINWAPYYIKATKDALEGTWSTGGVWWGVKEGAIDMVSVAADVPAETKAKVDTIRAGLKDGTFSIWKGPILGQDGKEVLAKDVVADDKFLGGVKFYVKGVEGKVPN